MQIGLIEENQKMEDWSERMRRRFYYSQTESETVTTSGVHVSGALLNE